MPKYLVEAKYTVEGLKGLLKEGGSSRRAAVERLTKGMDGRLEALYYTFGESDVFAIIDMPDHVTAAAVSLAINATGSVALKTTVLLTPEEVDAATKKTVDYRPPGR